MTESVFNSPLVGRGEEVGRLVDVLERARRGEAGPVLVAGGAGGGEETVGGGGGGRGPGGRGDVGGGGCVGLWDGGGAWLPFKGCFRVLARGGRLTAGPGGAGGG